MTNNLRCNGLLRNHKMRMFLSHKLMISLIVLGLLFIIFVIYLCIDSDGSNIGQTQQLRREEVECRFENVSRGDFRMMTFNLWYNGDRVEDGIGKIAKHIKIINPDIVCLQEVRNLKTLDKLIEKIGDDWEGIANLKIYSDIAIITKHKINQNDTFTSSTFIGLPFEMSGKLVRVANGHLAWKSYGPYGAINKMLTTSKQMMVGELNSDYSSRVGNVKELLENKRFKQWIYESDKVPLFACGDFNVPSHLDWVESTKEQHGGWKFEWPATKLLENGTGLKDAYRAKYPDPKANPGITWSTVFKYSEGWNFTIPEIQDRIDFIYYKESLFNVINAFTYCGNTSLKIQPNELKNDYPSDHYAVVADFKYKKT